MDVEEAFHTTSRQACFEARLVLESQGIRSVTEHYDDAWHLMVPINLLEQAREELLSYEQERKAEAARKPPRTKLYSGAIPGVISYVACLVLIAWLSRGEQTEQTWRVLGNLQTGLVMQGQWWRTVTALTLHVDLAHLLSNIAFGSLFGFLVGRSLGGGAGWLAIVIGGGLGNFANACFRDAHHNAIGASTAVFAALGILVTRAIFPRQTDSNTLFHRIQPLVGGILLFAYTGIGDEQTDVGAHFFGLVAGMLIGGIATLLPERVFASSRSQSLLAILALAIVVGSWAFALWG